MENNDKKRETFSSGLTVFFATLGSAVGLGNIWKFPYLTGKFGGGAFLFVYFICILLAGIPVMIGEFYIGRRTRKNPVGALEELRPRSNWNIMGKMGVLAAYLIIFFYSTVAGWVYSYVFKAIRGDFASITTESASLQFSRTVIGPLSPVLWQMVVVVVVCGILILGVKNGIEKITKTLMPLLFVLILICDIRAITLPGAMEGLKFLFKVDFGKINGAAVLTALGLAFFKLSVGMGTMITYGSYFTHDNNMVRTSVKVAISDTLVSMLAGIAIFPAVFSFGVEPGAGPGLLFMTIPLVFSKVPFGNLLLIGFFLLSAMAATMAMLSMTEVPVAYFSEEHGITRKKAVILNGIIIAAVGILASLSADKGSILGEFHVFGKTFFDLFDYISSNVLMPIGGLLLAIFVGYMTKKEELWDELSNHGVLKNRGLINLYYFVIRYITPALLMVIFLNSIGIIKF